MEDILTPSLTYKLNKEWAIFLAAIIGGPIAGAYLIGENYRNLGEPQKVKWIWLLAIAFMAFLFLVDYIPGINQIPPLLYPVLVAGLTQLYVKKYQSAAIRQHIADGGNVYPISRSVIVGVISCILIIGLILGLYMVYTGGKL